MGASAKGDGVGLSLGKILFTVLVIVLVWKGFGLVGRLARERREELAARAQGRAARRRRHGSQGSRTVELVQCRRCGAYFDPAEGCSCGAQAR